LGRIDANFGIQNVNASVEVNYDFGGSSFTFPPQGGPNTDDIAPSSKREFLLLLSHPPHSPPLHIY
jgi:hypothetical protein